LLEASTNKLPTPPPRLQAHPPILASTIRFPSRPPIVLVHPSNEGFDIVFQRWRVEIGKYEG
jgi:hypothetical protein